MDDQVIEQEQVAKAIATLLLSNTELAQAVWDWYRTLQRQDHE